MNHLFTIPRFMKKLLLLSLLVALSLAGQSCAQVAPSPQTIKASPGKAHRKQVTLTVNADGGPKSSFKYKWFKNQQEIAEATAATLTVSVDHDPEGTYFAKVSNDKGSVESDLVTVKLVDGEIIVSAATQPAPKTP